jgi:hypothetical protein
LEARHIETVHVVEIFMAGFAWEGDVEVFQAQHPSWATRCGWGYPSDDDPSRYQYVCVIGIGFAVTPRNAVVAANPCARTYLDQRSAPRGLEAAAIS